MAKKVKSSKKYLRNINGTWYLRVKVNGATVQQTLRTDNFEKACQLRDDRIQELTARLDEKKRLLQIKRQLAGI